MYKNQDENASSNGKAYDNQGEYTHLNGNAYNNKNTEIQNCIF